MVVVVGYHNKKKYKSKNGKFMIEKGKKYHIGGVLFENGIYLRNYATQQIPLSSR